MLILSWCGRRYGGSGGGGGYLEGYLAEVGLGAEHLSSPRHVGVGVADDPTLEGDVVAHVRRNVAHFKQEGRVR